LLVPVDDRIEGLDDEKRSDLLTLQDGPGRVANSKATDNGIEIIAGKPGQREPGQRNLRFSKQARHQIFIAELDLEDIHAKLELPTAAQAQHTDRRGAAIEFIEMQAHPARRLLQTGPQIELKASRRWWRSA
jgi:hypothetical protein